MFVYPQPGVLVRDPDKRDLIPKEGREVDGASPYWIRRLADKDITTDKPASAAASADALVAAAAALPRAGSKVSPAASTETDSGSTNA
jgi:hypothetical protein